MILSAAPWDCWEPGDRTPGYPPGEWATLVSQLGLLKTLIPEADRDSDLGRARGIGVVLSAHRDETYVGENDDERPAVRLVRARRRFDAGVVSTRYRFKLMHHSTFPCDEEGTAD